MSELPSWMVQAVLLTDNGDYPLNACGFGDLRPSSSHRVIWACSSDHEKFWLLCVSYSIR